MISKEASRLKWKSINKKNPGQVGKKGGMFNVKNVSTHVLGEKKRRIAKTGQLEKVRKKRVTGRKKFPGEGKGAKLYCCRKT